MVPPQDGHGHSASRRRPPSRVARAVALGGPLAAGAAVAALHVLRLDHDPVTQRLSEYAGGPHGWLLTTAFVAAAAGLPALAATARASRGHHAWQRLVTSLALVGAAGMVLSALSPTGVSGRGEAVHSIASSVAAVAVAALAVVWSFGEPSPSSARRTVALVVAGLLVVSPVLHDTGFTGIGQRLLWAAVLGWVLLAIPRAD